MGGTLLATLSNRSRQLRALHDARSQAIEHILQNQTEQHAVLYAQQQQLERVQALQVALQDKVDPLLALQRKLDAPDVSRGLASLGDVVDILPRMHKIEPQLLQLLSKQQNCEAQLTAHGERLASITTTLHIAVCTCVGLLLLIAIVAVRSCMSGRRSNG